MPPIEYLQGGRKDAIRLVDGRLYRPSGPWSANIHAFLRALRLAGFAGAPEPFGFDGEGCEILSFLEGDVCHGPLAGEAGSLATLQSAARLLRAYHDASSQFAVGLSGEEVWLMPVRQPVEVICHSDFAPYNVVLRAGRAAAIIDFDTAHPGPRIWDLAYALYRWAPLSEPDNDGITFDSEQQMARARLFLDAYGADSAMRRQVPGVMQERLQALVDSMQARADAGEVNFQQNIVDGHDRLYLRDIAYIGRHEAALVRALMA